MEKTIQKAQKAIREMNKYSLVTYLKILGLTPRLIYKDKSIFPSPFTDSQDSMLIVDHKTNTFRVTFSLKGGTLMDLAQLIFRESPEDILEGIARFRVDHLMSTDETNPAGQP